MSDSAKVLPHYDIAVVGAGVAGCYVAYRLLQAGPDDFEEGSPLRSIVEERALKVALFEYSGRIGGRLLSTELPDVPELDVTPDKNTEYRQYTEFGGFRFQPQMHIVSDLVDHLQLTHQPFPVDEPGENFVYVRGVRLRRAQLEPKFLEANPDFKLPYDLGDSRRGTNVLDKAFEGVLGKGGYTRLRTAYQTAFQKEDWSTVAAKRKELEDAKQKAEVDGRPLTDWSWWALKKRFLSQEALDYGEDSAGYNELWTSGNISSPLGEDFYFTNEDDLGFGPSYPYKPQPPENTVWKHVIEGYSAIPLRLYEGFVGTADGTGQQNNPDQKGEAFLQHQLIGFDKQKAGGYVLTFFLRESGTTPPWRAAATCEENPGTCKQVTCDRLVLALPQRALSLIEQNNFFFTDETVERLLNTAIDDDALRLFMAYDTPWWTKAATTTEGDPTTYPPVHRGRSTTDLPIRQFYYWLTSPEGKQSILLASYTNGQAEKFWEGIQDVPLGQAAYDKLKGSQDPQENVVAPAGFGPRAAPSVMADLAHEMIVEVVGPLTDGSTPPKPYYAHYQNWTKDPWGAGWHAWRSGVNDDETIPQVLQPLPKEQVFICGESYSNVQGWVQGALNTSEVLLQNKFGLKWPSWLTKGGTWLGPGSKDPGE